MLYQHESLALYEFVYHSVYVSEFDCICVSALEYFDEKINLSSVGANMYQYVSICINMYQYVSISCSGTDLCLLLKHLPHEIQTNLK